MKIPQFSAESSFQSIEPASIFSRGLFATRQAGGGAGEGGATGEGEINICWPCICPHRCFIDESGRCGCS
jgi:hypothetical protein